MSDKNFKVKNGIDAVGPITISPSSNSIDGIVINTPIGGKAIRFIRVGTGEVGSIDEWGTLVVSGGIQVVQPWYVRTPGLEAQSHFWTADYRSAAGFGGTSTGTNPVIYISSWSGGTNDLTQWITPNNTILAKVDYLGNITARDLTLSGNLTVNGTTTNLNSTNLIIEDKNIIIADVATPTDTTADGAGITIKGATDKTFNWVQSTGRFTSSEPVQSSAFVSTYIYASQIGSTVIGTATLNTNSDTGGLLINTAGAANKGLILRSAASATANLQEWQRSDGTYDLAFNNGSGSLNKLVFTDARAWGIYWGAEPLLNTSTGYLIVKSWSEDRPAFVVRAKAGQSNALQIWQDSSGGTKSYVDQDGVIYASSGLITGTASAHIGTYRPNIKLNINNNDAGYNPLSIKGAASQTSDYLYIANSAGSFIASISSSGQFISAAKSLNLDSGNLSFGYGGGGSSGNLAIGTYALNSNTTGNVNLALGAYALQNNTTGGYNVAIGTGSLYYNVSGAGNTAIGSVALQNNLTNDQTAIGIGSLFSATTGSANTGLGSSALNKVTTGGLNTAVGRLSGYKLTSGNANTVIGSYAMYNGDTEVSTGSNNTVIGYESGAANLGSGNVFIGFQSAKNETGSDKLYIANSSTSTPLIGGDFSAGTLSLSANTFITAKSTSVAPLIVKYITGQSGNIQEWRNEVNGVMSYINVYGSFFTSNNVGGSSGSFGPSIVGNPSGVVLTSQGMAGQTGDLQQWKNSNGTVLASINSDGSFALSRSQYTSASLGVWASVNSDPSGGNSGIGLVIKTYNATSRGIGIFGSASQTADLQQWGNSAGTVLAYVNSEGSIYSGNRVVSPGDFEGRSNSFLGSPSFNLATLNISTRATNQSGIVVRGYASQTANLQEWQNSSGTVLANIASTGQINAGAGLYSDWAGIGTARIGAAHLSVATQYLGNVGLIVKGSASQSADYFQIQTSGGTVVVSADASNSLAVPYGQISAASGLIGAGATRLGTAGVTAYANAATSNGIIVRGAASQSANLQEWQNSAGTVLASISANGTVYMGSNGGANIATFFNGTSGYGAGSINASGTFNINGANLGFPYAASGAVLSVNATYAGSVPITARGYASQTANLQEWQDSGGNVWAHVGLSGSRFGASGSQGATFIDQYGNLTVRSNSTVFGNSIVSVGTAGATSTGITVRGVTSQTANLQEWQDSTGLVLSKVDSAGRWYGTDGVFSLGVAVGATGSPGPNLYVKSRYASQIASAFRGYASQTANLTEWQNSDGTVLAKVDANGSAQFLGLNVQGTGSGIVNIGTAAAGYVGLIIKGVASQSADLQQWQNSNGDVLANITSTGRLRVTAEVIGTGSYVVLGSNGGLGEVVYLGYNYTTSIGAGGIVFNRTVRPPDTSTVGIIIRGNASQTANLQEWQNSAGQVRAKIDSYGGFSSLATTTISNDLNGTGTALVVQTKDAGGIPIVIKGFTSQTADLQQWQNSVGTVITRIDSSGENIWTYSIRPQATPSSGSIIQLDSNQVRVTQQTAGAVAFIVKGAASQTANLQEWQNSAGTVIANIYPNGTAGLYGLEVFTGGAGITGNYGNTDTLQVRINGAARRGILVKGAVSQSANLQEWQNSDGTILALVDAYGRLGINSASLINSSGGYSMVSIYNNNTVNTNLTIKSYASQTANLTEWQNNSGTVLAKVDVLGNFTATSKSFDINHPTKENMRLRYGSLEGPENGVYIRGTAQSSIIELPEYWTGLVHEDSITVSLTSAGSAQNIYVEKIENNKIYIGGDLEKAFFTVYGERKDIDKLTVEY